MAAVAAVGGDTVVVVAVVELSEEYKKTQHMIRVDPVRAIGGRAR